ncbi:hypothetical protein AU196_22345 [Mycobacterium sp. IS-1742]|uniref:hypothetical protein n=1 Tax=Mycobacterium sp. IS-1742 TaxID=1772285 RepID=UPI0007400944|nr:hypothetical protein [Mycobacterium sp. IS-1742]KUI25561.1 hypothetical protein AU196_22345 [Mycobacterium sp. IS-1742]
MTSTALTLALIGFGIVGTTVWGNVEFCRRRNRGHTGDVFRQDMSAFSPTIDDVDLRPFVQAGRLRVSRRNR